MRICRYLRSRHPHPDHDQLDGVITSQMRQEHANDPTYRLRRFLLLVTGSQLLPSSDEQRLRVCYMPSISCHMADALLYIFRSDLYTSIRMSRSEIRYATLLSFEFSHRLITTIQQDGMTLIPMKGHTCSFALAVPINAAALTLLQEEMPEDDDEATSFDVWLHQATLAADFNSV